MHRSIFSKVCDEVSVKSKVTKSNIVGEGFPVGDFIIYHKDESGYPEAHEGGPWFFEPKDFGGGEVFSEGFRSKLEAIKAVRKKIRESSTPEESLVNEDWKVDLHSVWDNEGDTIDRYSVVLKDGNFLSLSDDPGHPQGFSQWGHGVKPGPHLGKKISFDKLPPKVKAHVNMRMMDESAETNEAFQRGRRKNLSDITGKTVVEVEDKDRSSVKLMFDDGSSLVISGNTEASMDAIYYKLETLRSEPEALQDTYESKKKPSKKELLDRFGAKKAKPFKKEKDKGKEKEKNFRLDHLGDK